MDLHTGDSQNAISNNEDSKDSLGTNTIVSKEDQTNPNNSNSKVSSVSIYLKVVIFSKLVEILNVMILSWHSENKCNFELKINWLLVIFEITC